MSDDPEDFFYDENDLYTPEGVAAKAEWEGGLEELLWGGYGLTPELITPGPFRDLYKATLDAFETHVAPLYDKLEEMLPDV